MRRILSCSAFFLLCSSTLWAADGSGERWRVSILASEISKSDSNVWSDDAHAGIGVGVAYAPTAQWDVELTASQQNYRSPYTRLLYIPPFDGGPGDLVPVTEFHRYRVMPLDLSVTRHFLTDQVIAPYVRAGVRYVDAPGNPAPTTTVIGNYPNPPFVHFTPVSEGFGFQDRTSAQAGAGVRLRLTPRTAIRAEAMRLLRSEDADFDPLTRYAVGVSWLF